MNEEALQKFDPTTAELTALVERTKGISADDLENPEQMKVVKESRQALQRARVNIEKKGKALREDALKFQKAVIAKEKELIAIIEPEEERLSAIEEEAKKIALRKARLEGLPAKKARLLAISKHIEMPSDEEILAMDANTFEAQVNFHTARCLEIERAEINREKVKEEARIKAEQDKKQAELDAQQKKIDEEKAKIEHQKEIVQAEERARIETQKRMEREAKEKEERVKREADEKEKREKEKRDREEKAAADKLAEEKAQREREIKAAAEKLEQERKERERKEAERMKKEAEEKAKRCWLIWSIEHQGWWKENHNGYVKVRKAAGGYTLEEALEIVKGANIGEHDVPNEAMIKA